jgi:cellulose biosynthesis protein BcsQ
MPVVPTTPKIISLFNHKGGVSKTTTTFNLGWAIAGQGKRVLIVDGDPQCNLTGTVLGFGGVEDFAAFYDRVPQANICTALRPAFDGRPEQLQPALPQPTSQRNLQILAGHIDLSLYEAQLAVAFSTAQALPALRNLPGAVGHLLRLTAGQNGIDVVLVDMSPSVGALNQSLFLSSDYFIVPTSPDYFCYLALNSLATVLPRWHESAALHRGAMTTYKLPDRGPKFLGIISQRYRPRSGNPAAAFQKWIDKIKETVNTTLVPALAPLDMVVNRKDFEASGAGDTPYNLANIADFNSLIAQSQAHNTPVFALSDSQLQTSGIVLKTMKESRDNFVEVFDQLASCVLRLAQKPA